MATLESNTERGLSDKAKAKGFISIKLGGLVGIPDRLILAPGGRLCFVELKQRRGRYGQLQTWWRDRLLEFGFKYFKCDRVEIVQEILEYLTGDVKT